MSLLNKRDRHPRKQRPQHSEHETEERSDQRESGIDRLKNHIKRRKQNNDAQAVSQKANSRDANLRLMLRNVLRGRRHIAGNDERVKQYVIAENHYRKSEQAAPACDFRSGAL